MGGSVHNAGTESLTCSASHRGMSERNGTEPLKHTHRVPYVGKHTHQHSLFCETANNCLFFFYQHRIITQREMKRTREVSNRHTTETNDGQIPPNPNKLRLLQTCEPQDPFGGWCMVGTQCAFATWNERYPRPLGNLLQ